jgi:hypothetical protein
MGCIGREAAELLERRFQAAEGLIEHAPQMTQFVVRIVDREALASWSAVIFWAFFAISSRGRSTRRANA